MTHTTSPSHGSASRRKSPAPAVSVEGWLLDPDSGEVLTVKMRAPRPRSNPFGSNPFSLVTDSILDLAASLTPRQSRVWWGLVRRMNYENRVVEPPSLVAASLGVEYRNFLSTLRALAARGLLLVERYDDGKTVAAIFLNPNYIGRGRSIRQSQDRWQQMTKPKPGTPPPLKVIK